MNKFYRNTLEVVSSQGTIIEVGFLWERNGELMVLVDEDQYITAPYEIKNFNLEKKK